MTDFVRQQLRQQGQTPPYRLLAMSLGGMVATDWAQTQPQEVAQLVLVNTSMRPHSRLSERLRPGNWGQLALLAARWHDAGYAERVVHRLTSQRPDTLAADIAHWEHIRKTAPVTPANAWCQLWAAARFACGPLPPACPTLILSSAGDQLVHPVCSQRIASAWHAPSVRHPWAGHDLPHDDGAWVVAEMTRHTGCC